MAYETVVVGSDGSSWSYGAVERAAELAAVNGARLVVVSAHHPLPDPYRARAADTLGAESYKVAGARPAQEALRDAADRAREAGATDVTTVAVEGEPVTALIDTAVREGADLLVVGNRGTAHLAGRLLGTVSAGVVRRAPCDVLVANTAGRG